MHRFRRAHARGALLEDITGWIDGYVFRPTRAAMRMEDNAAAIVDDGHAMWEQGLADPSAPWAEYVTDRQRAVLNDMIARLHLPQRRVAAAAEGTDAGANGGAQGSGVTAICSVNRRQV